MKEVIDNEGTKIKCQLTSCMYNSSCCITPADLKESNVYCKCLEIEIKVDDSTGDLQCCQWEWGNKLPQCEECQLYSNGEIVIPFAEIEFSDIEIEEDEEDDF